MTQIYVGRGCYAPPDFDSGYSSRSLFEYQLCRRENFPTSEVNWRFINSFILHENPALYIQLRQELQNALDLALQSGLNDMIRKTFIGNILSLLPYTYPEEGVTMDIPVKIDGVWRKVTYSVDRKIPLTPSLFSSPLYAYGLLPSDEDASPILAFLGTTYPAGDGFIASLLADFTPLLSVGHAPYLSGRSALLDWLEGKSGIRAYGVSLGGALSIHVTRNHQQYFSEVNAYNPPGLYPWNRREYHSSVRVNIFHQEYDIISSMGFVPKGENVRIYNLFSRTWTNPLKAHNLIFSGGEEVRIVKSTPDHENWRITRIALTILHLLFAPIFVFIPLFCLQIVYRIFELMWQGVSLCGNRMISRQLHPDLLQV